MPETYNKDSYSNTSNQGPGTPEIVRKRRNNVNRNNAKWNAIGLPAVNGGAAASGGASTSNGCSGSLLSAVAGPGATRNGHAGEKRGGGGVHGGDNRIGDALVPLAGLEERWPGRKQEISELAGLIGESTDGVPVPPLLVTGPPCTGKTSVVRAVLGHRGCSYAYVNCAEVVQRRDLLEALVEQVAGGSRDDILAANRVDRTFGDASTENGPSSSSSSSATATATAAPVAEEEARLGTAEISREQDLVLDAEARGQQGADQGSRQQQQQQQQQQRKGRGRGPRCSSWNVFFRQLAALLARRSQALLNKSPTTPAAAAAGGCSGGGRGGGDTACGSVCGDVGTNAGGGGGGGGSAGDASGGPPPPEFAPKLFVVLDNAEALLSETVAGIGVGAGGAGGAGNQWRGQDILTKLASLQGMVDSLTGFAGEEAALTATGGGDQDLHSNASNISIAHRPSQSTPFGRHHHHHHQQEQGQPPLPPICPILISQNGFFASEIMGGRGVGGDWRGAGGRNRSLVMNAYPVQVRFPPYTKEHLPSVLASTAHMFGLDLNVNLRDGGRGGGGGSSEGGGESGRKRRVRGNDEGRKLFRKMATALVTTLQNETRDAWELGAEAARIWPAYKRSAEDGCYDAHLAAALKPLLTETTKRLHGFGRQDDDKRQNQSNNGKDKRGRNGDAKKEGRAKPNGLGLSRSGKHLLVAAYLASHNSRDTDRDMFTAKSTKRSKRQRSTRSSAGNAENLVEAGVQDLPEAREFQLERLLSIMSSIVAVTEAGTKAANSMGSTELFAQIKSLTKLNLMRDCGQRKSFDLDCPSYRCNISRELAEAVAKEIGLDLSQYLVTA